jgi:hypothetical protein
MTSHCTYTQSATNQIADACCVLLSIATTATHLPVVLILCFDCLTVHTADE